MNEYAHNSARYGYEPEVVACVKEIERAVSLALKSRSPVVSKEAFTEWFSRYVKPLRHKFIAHEKDVRVDCRMLDKALNRRFAATLQHG